MRLVLDASVLVEVILRTHPGLAAGTALEQADEGLYVPEHAVLEVVSALRGLVRGGRVSLGEADLALAALAKLDIERWPLDPLVVRAWALRDTVTPYDAMYVALAEGLGATLLTMDARLARGLAGVARCPVTLVE